VLPASEVHRLTQQLAGLTGGEGLLESAFDHYREIRGPVPVSPYADTRERLPAPGSP
jgi:ribosomal protection tetracycline resistance protein